MQIRDGYAQALVLLKLPADVRPDRIDWQIRSIASSELHARKWHEAAAIILKAQADEANSVREANNATARAADIHSKQAETLLNCILQLLENDAYTALKVKQD